MAGREEGRRSALVITDELEVARELSEAIEGVGLCVRVVSSLDHLEAHADARPSLVITDLQLKPSVEQWGSLSQLFPRSTLWALCGKRLGDVDTIVAAFKHGCRECLTRPVTAEALGQKLTAMGRLPGSKPGELDRYVSNEIRLELPNDVSVIEHVVKLLADRCREYRSYSQKTLVNLRIAVSEALSNAILNGNQGDRSKRVRIRASVDAWKVKVQVTDEGPGFDPKEVPDPTDSHALEGSGGRGVFLLRRLADDVMFNETGNSVTIALHSDWEEVTVEGEGRAATDDPHPLAGLIERIRSSSGADLHLWSENVDGALEHLAPPAEGAAEPSGALHWLRTPGIRYAVELRDGAEPGTEHWAEFARDLLDEAVSHELQLFESKRDLAERQEEIELLHSITETLGGVTKLEDAASQILKGVVRVTGADRASLWIYDPPTEELVLAASEGPARYAAGRVPVSSGASVSALAFRENRTVRLDEARDLPPGLTERLGPKPEPWVSVPVSYSSPTGGSRTVGVLNLIGRRSGAVISHVGETRLLMTLARQIGSAVENLRLLEEIVSRERLIGELELAHSLQMKLLPDLSEFKDVADVAARCVPARPVGGDFYQLFELADGKIGAMLGDVTSHGFSASLIMALSMSVTAIYARQSVSPGDLLRAIHRALIQKLESTEMFMTVFYGVIDRAHERLAYANAGHAHAFRLHGEKVPERLVATSPPLGIAEYGSYGESLIAWEPGDTLCLFTDGLTNPALRTTETKVLEAVSRHRSDPAAKIIDAMFEARGKQGGQAPDDQTAFVLRA